MSENESDKVAASIEVYDGIKEIFEGDETPATKGDVARILGILTMMVQRDSAHSSYLLSLALKEPDLATYEEYRQISKAVQSATTELVVGMARSRLKAEKNEQ